MWLFVCYTIQLITLKLCTKFQNPNQVVAEKSLTEKKFTDKQTDKQTNIITEKAKTIYPLYTSYRGYNKEIHKVKAQQSNIDNSDTYFKSEIHKVKAQQSNIDNSDTYFKSETCSYCGLTGAHPKGINCPAYGVQCEICNKYDHFTSVCRFNWRKQDAETKSHTIQYEHVIIWRIKKAKEDHLESDTSSDGEFLEKSASNMGIKIVKNLSDENLNLSQKISGLQDSVIRFGRELEAAKKIISSLVSPQIHMEHYPCNKISEEINQQRQKDWKQCLHVRTVGTKDIQTTEQSTCQNNGKKNNEKSQKVSEKR